jgi:hypothetical protein
MPETKRNNKSFKEKLDIIYKTIIRYNNIFKVTMIFSVIFLSFKSFMFSKEINNQNATIREQSLSIIEMQEKINQQELLIGHLIQNNISRNRNFNDLKVPFWIKAKQGDKYVMIFVNKFFEDVFLKPNDLTKFDYIGRSDETVFGEMFASIYKKSDSVSSLIKEPRMFEEPLVDKYGTSGRIKSIKWREITPTDTLIYGVGIMF